MDFTLDNIRDRIRLGTVRKEHRPIIERGLPEMTPIEYIKSGRVYLGFEVDDQLLPYMVSKYGLDCWTYASDIPHAHRKPDAANMLLSRKDMPEGVAARMLVEGTASLYGLDIPEGAGVTA
jgi:hypothetical protein